MAWIRTFLRLCTIAMLTAENSGRKVIGFTDDPISSSYYDEPTQSSTVLSAANKASVILQDNRDTRDNTMSNIHKEPGQTDSHETDRVPDDNTARIPVTSSDSKIILLLEKLIHLQHESNQMLASNLSELISAHKKSIDLLADMKESMHKNLGETKESVDSVLNFLKAMSPKIKPRNVDDSIFLNYMWKLHNRLHSKIKEALGIRPTRYPGDNLIVTLDVDLYRIIEMNEAEEYVKAYIHVNMTFFNNQLGWDPYNYGGIKSTQIDAHDEMWIPDVFLYNGVELANENQLYRPSPRITTVPFKGQYFDDGYNSKAQVEVSYPQIVKFSCSFDTFYFPFDYQFCAMEFRSWSYSMHEVYIISGDHRKNYTKENDEWVILSVAQDSKFERAGPDGKQFSVYQEEILLRRRPLYYIVNLLVPSIIITQVAFFGFFSPSSSDGDRTEKVNLGMGTLLAMSVMLLTVCGMTPINSAYIPLSGIFFIFTMVLIAAGVIMTTYIMMIHQRGKRKKRVPKTIQSIFFRLAPWLGLKIPTIIRRCSKFKQEANQNNEDNNHQEACLLEEIPHVKKLSEHIETIINGRRKELAEVEYIFLAKILDAIMLILFSLLLWIATAGIVVIILKQPYPKDYDPNSVLRNSIFWRLDDEIMELFDENKDGFIVKNEVRNIFHHFKNLDKEGDYDFLRITFFGRYMDTDANDDKRISRSEISSLRQPTHVNLRTIISNADTCRYFTDADLNSDQMLDKNEFFLMWDRYMHAVRLVEPFTSQPLPSFTRAENYLSPKEKNRLLEQAFLLAEINGDGVVNIAEMLAAIDFIESDITSAIEKKMSKDT